ncbi:MAG: DNA polymerase III subunit epsilon, partial [Betaproteobacteria bacterium]|nr:DNA polymerase III subunit epsilon [Betaproteobacteria bacterium]
WRHLGTVHDEAELEELLRERRAGAGFGFDLDTYRLLLAHLARPGRAQPLPLRAPRADPAGIGEPA